MTVQYTRATDLPDISEEYVILLRSQLHEQIARYNQMLAAEGYGGRVEAEDAMEDSDEADATQLALASASQHSDDDRDVVETTSTADGEADNQEDFDEDEMLSHLEEFLRNGREYYARVNGGAHGKRTYLEEWKFFLTDNRWRDS